jgi:hypothetical protein
MARVAPPLTARLRHRLRAVAWLFALVIITKGLLASLCVTDGLTQFASTDTAAIATAEASPVHLDEDAVPCWHAGAEGCHCSCVHASALATTASVLLAGPLAIVRPAPSTAPPPQLLLPPMLRPPIA